MTPLIAQEIYLLERYSSKECFGQMRDSWEAAVVFAESHLDRFMRQLPPNYGGRPIPSQPDIVWGQRVLPNLRDTLTGLNDAYIRLTHGDATALLYADGILGDLRGEREFSYDWFDEVEAGSWEKYEDLRKDAIRNAGNIAATVNTYWKQGSLSFRYAAGSRGPLAPPDAWPRYRLTPSATVNTKETVGRTGTYVPQVDDGCAQFLIAGRPAPRACIGYDPETLQYISREPTLWSLVERVDGETVADGLANLLETGSTPVVRVAAGHTAPQSGWWFSPASQGSRRYFKHGDVFPEVEANSYGATFWQWSPDQTVPKL